TIVSGQWFRMKFIGSILTLRGSLGVSPVRLFHAASRETSDPAARCGLRPLVGQAQLEVVLTLLPTYWKVLLALEPRALMAAMQTTMIRASMTAYSTAVGPSSAFRNFTRAFVNLRISFVPLLEKKRLVLPG